MSSDTITNQISQRIPNLYKTSNSVEEKPAENLQETAVEEGKALPPADEAKQINDEELQIAVSNLNEYVQQIGRDLLFSVDKSSERIVVQVLNTETKEIVRQIPSEDVLRVSSNIQNLIDDDAGLLFETFV
ncbi:hypothetical protein MNBD_GAMMA08-1604 [hydrothermal vent metagenome]|uniref:Flagellar protein FlaG n=1 Tax=hydrothermal vent metagenome TaxID=652676 RepID=A0A3B0X5Y4_9ZZZZ